MVWPLTPRSLATSATFLPDAIRSRTRRLNSGGYLLGMPTSSGGHGHDESNDATPPKWGNISGERRRWRGVDGPPHHPAGVRVQDDRTVDLALPGGVLGDVGDPQLIRSRSGEPPVHQILRG